MFKNHDFSSSFTSKFTQAHATGVKENSGLEMKYISIKILDINPKGFL